MRKLSLLLLASAIATSSFAQTPGKVNRGLTTKISATWCGPCGAWGWTLMDEIKTATHDKAMYMGIFSSTNGAWNNSAFLNETAKAFQNVTTWMGNGYPSNAANAIDKSKQNTTSGVNVAGVKADVIAAINDFAAAPVVASTGYTVEKTGNTIKVKTKTKFWEAASGQYYLAAYMVEDGALNYQASKSATNTNPADKIAHANVLRGSMTGNTMADAWGVEIVNGAITADQTFDKEFTYTVTNSDWDMSKLKVQMILWKKEGSAYKYVNGNDISQFATSVTDISGINNLNIYPNPATEYANVNFVTTKSTDVTINMIDAVGRTIYTSGTINVTAGESVHSIPTASLPAGTYNVIINSDNGVATKRLAVIK